MQAQMLLSSVRLVICGYRCLGTAYWGNGFPVFSSVPVNANECVGHMTLFCGFCRGRLKGPAISFSWQTLELLENMTCFQIQRLKGRHGETFSVSN